MSISVTVTRNGTPLTGAGVTIVDSLTSDTVASSPSSGTTWFAGGTDTEGTCDSVCSIPTQVDRVDLIVHHDECVGRYTDEGLRTYWGPFAPSSRISVRVLDLGAVQVALEDR